MTCLAEYLLGHLTSSMDICLTEYDTLITVPFHEASDCGQLGYRACVLTSMQQHEALFTELLALNTSSPRLGLDTQLQLTARAAPHA